MDGFDNKVLETIFLYLSFEDRKNVRLTCRKFREICGFSRFSQFEKLVIRPCYDTDTFRDVLRQSKSEILHLELRNMKLSQFPPTIWNYVRNKLTTLSLTQCFITAPDIVHIVDECHRLRYLELFRNTDLSMGDSLFIKAGYLRNIHVLKTAFYFLTQRKVKRENLEALHINIMDPLDSFSSNFLQNYILQIFPGIKVICITHILFCRPTTMWSTGLNDYSVLTYKFSEYGRNGVHYGSLGSDCRVPILQSPQGFRQFISIRSLRYQLLFFIKNELEESIRSDILRQRADINFYIWRNCCPILFNFFHHFGYIGNVRINLRILLLQFFPRADRMLFSRREFLTALNSYLNSRNLGIFQLDDDDLFFYWIQLPFERNLPALCFAQTENVPEPELCQFLQQCLNVRQLKLLGISDNVLRKVFICQKELLCFYVRMSTFGCPYCHYSAYKFNENWIKYQQEANHFHIWSAASIRDLTNLQCLILDYRTVSDVIVFEEEALNEFILPALRHFSIYGTNQLFLWKIALMVAINAPDLELLEFTGGCPFDDLKKICSACKNLHYLRCDHEFYQYEHRLHYDSRITLFENHDKLQVISQNNYHFFYDRSRRRMTDKLFEQPPYIELKRCPFAPSMHS